ncbi:MAG: ribosome maturation factor RimM [Dethiobacteria bacterium]
MEQGMTNIGKIISPFGIKGAVKVYPYSDFIDRIHKLKRVKVASDESGCWRTIEHSSVHQQRFWIIKFSDIQTREEAESLRGSLIMIKREERMDLPEGHYYLDQIINLDVHELNGNYLGKIVDILRTGSNDVYIVKKDTASQEILIPALKEVVKKIDLERGLVIVDLPDGL